MACSGASRKPGESRHIEIFCSSVWEWMEHGGLHISVYRKLPNVVGSGARRKPGESRHIEIIVFLQFRNGWNTEGSTYPCIGNSRMWLARAPDGRWANPDTWKSLVLFNFGMDGARPSAKAPVCQHATSRRNIPPVAALAVLAPLARPAADAAPRARAGICRNHG